MCIGGMCFVRGIIQYGFLIRSDRCRACRYTSVGISSLDRYSCVSYSFLESGVSRGVFLLIQGPASSHLILTFPLYCPPWSFSLLFARVYVHLGSNVFSFPPLWKGRGQSEHTPLSLPVVILLCVFLEDSVLFSPFFLLCVFVFLVL